MTGDETKSAFGYLILLASVIGFFVAFLSYNYYLAILLIIAGVVAWLVYLNLAAVRVQRQTGAVLIVFGILLSSAIFMTFGLEQDLWGGYRVKPDGAILSLLILFFAVMPGLVFLYLHRPAQFTAPFAPTILPQPPAEPMASPAVIPTEWGEYEVEYPYDPEAMAAYYEGQEDAEET